MTNYTRVHNELVRKVLLYLHDNYLGRWWWNETATVKTDHGYRSFGLSGSADIIGHTHNGRAVYIEIKTGNAKLKPNQIDFKNMVLAHKCIHIVVYNDINSEDFTALKRRSSNE